MTFSSAVCSLVAAVAMIVLALIGLRNEHATGMFVDGCDAFGYSRMAKVFRQARKTGGPTDFFIRDDQTRWLVARFKERGTPVNDWDEVVTAHAHHYFPGSDQVGPQYPPGTGWVLSMFATSTDVKALDRLTILLVTAGAGLSPLRWHSPVPSDVVAHTAPVAVQESEGDPVEEGTDSPSPLVVASEPTVTAQDVEIIADLDNLLSHEESRLWTEDDTARF